MEKTTQITAIQSGQTALLLILSQITVKLAERFHLVIAPESILAALFFIYVWWTHRHTTKTAVVIDTLANNPEAMTVREAKILAPFVAEVAKEGLHEKINPDTIAQAKQLANERLINPRATVQDVIEKSQMR